MKEIKILTSNLKEIRKVDERLLSYNIEMTEITGGTFWKEYTKEQIAGTEEYIPITGMEEYSSLMQVYPPINLYNERLRKLAKELGSVWVRVSGTWATKTYYDFDGTTNGIVPEGYQSVLTKEQWIGVLEFVKVINGKLMVSVSNCAGLHLADEPWNSSEAEKLFGLSKEYGVPIEAAEFMNEPNMLATSGAPEGYTPQDYVRDQDLFFAWVRENYPETLLVGPSSTGDEDNDSSKSGGIGSLLETCSTAELLDDTKEKLDVFSYHCYNGISERMASLMPNMHWSPEEALSEEYLAVALNAAKDFTKVRDKYCKEGQMWVTESGDAGAGGNTWASTFMDVFRSLNELGGFAKITDGVIFHNTLASSDYGYLKHGTFEPRPNYFAILLWKRLMGEIVYETNEVIQEGAHVYAHSRKDGKAGVAYLIINNSKTDKTIVDIPKDAQVYVLSAETLRSKEMLLNGKTLVLGENDTLPAIEADIVSAGTLELAPTTCTFIIM